MALIGAGLSIFYLLFFSQVMQIKDITINGLKTLKPEEILTVIDSEMNRNFLHPLHIKLQKNILFFDDAHTKSEILSQFPIIKALKIHKSYLHKMVVTITERNAMGTWCFGQDSLTPPTASCRYFDNEGYMWNKAIRSSGSLLLTIEDLRTMPENINKADSVFIEAIKNIIVSLNALNIEINKIELPNDPTDDLKVYINQDYYIVLNARLDLDKQLDALRIFLSSNKDMHPEYIDARIAGRIYYK